MLVLSREAGSSVSVKSRDEACLLTVLKVSVESRSISLLINRAAAAIPGELESRVIELSIGGSHRIGQNVELTLVDVRAVKARVGIVAPREASVHRLEVFQAPNRDEDDSNGGNAGSPVRRPSSPQPPSLNVKLDEPRPPEENDV